MTEQTRPSSQKDFDAYGDRNGRDPGQEAPRDVGRPGNARIGLRLDLAGEAEAVEAIERATAALGQDDGAR